MDNHQAMILAGQISGLNETLKFGTTDKIERMERAAERSEWAAQEIERQIDRLEALFSRPDKE